MELAPGVVRHRQAGPAPAVQAVVRADATQQPRPGRLRFRSGTTVPSGPATKRIISSAGRASPVTMQVRSFMSSFLTATMTLSDPRAHHSASDAEDGAGHDRRLFLGALFGLGFFLIGAQVFLGDPADGQTRGDDHLLSLGA